MPARPNYYKVPLSGLGWKELGRMGGLLAPVIWVLKLFRPSMPMASGSPEPAPLSQMRVSAAALTPELRDAMEAMHRECESLGFGTPIFYRQPASLMGGMDAAAAVCVHQSRELFVNLLAGRSATGLKTIMGLVSGFDDGTFLSCGNERKQLEPNPRDSFRYLPGSDAAALLRVHEEELKKLRTKKTVRAIPGDSALETLLFDYEMSAQRWHEQRGAYVRMSDEEVASAQRQHSTATQGASGPVELLAMRLDHIADVEKPGMIAGSLIHSIVADTIAATTEPETRWMTTLSTPQGNGMLNFKFKFSRKHAVPGTSAPCVIERASKSCNAVLLDRLARLLGQPTNPLPADHASKLTGTVELVKGSLAESDLAGESAWCVLRLQLEGVSGSLSLLLNPVLHEAILQAGPDLAHETAMEAFRSLLA